MQAFPQRAVWGSRDEKQSTLLTHVGNCIKSCWMAWCMKLKPFWASDWSPPLYAKNNWQNSIACGESAEGTWISGVLAPGCTVTLIVISITGTGTDASSAVLQQTVTQRSTSTGNGKRCVLTMPLLNPACMTRGWGISLWENTRPGKSTSLHSGEPKPTLSTAYRIPHSLIKQDSWIH